MSEQRMRVGQAPIEMIVSETRTEAVDVRRFGSYGDEIAPVPGPTWVRFTGHNVAWELDWTWRGDPPPLGERWTLAPLTDSSEET